jgi:hypothetical protein
MNLVIATSIVHRTLALLWKAELELRIMKNGKKDVTV